MRFPALPSPLPPMNQFNASAEAAYGVQDYSPRTSIEGLEIHPLRRFNDDGGSMSELARLRDGRLEGVEGFLHPLSALDGLDVLLG